MSIRSGHVVGTQAGANSARILLWNAGTGEVSPVGDNLEGIPIAVSGRGFVVGWLYGLNIQALVKAGTAEVRVLPVTDPKFMSGGPSAVTDNDIVYGWDTLEDGTYVNVRWDCSA